MFVFEVYTENKPLKKVWKSKFTDRLITPQSGYVRYIICNIIIIINNNAKRLEDSAEWIRMLYQLHYYSHLFCLSETATTLTSFRCGHSANTVCPSSAWAIFLASYNTTMKSTEISQRH